MDLADMPAARLDSNIVERILTFSNCRLQNAVGNREMDDFDLMMRSGSLIAVRSEAALSLSRDTEKRLAEAGAAQ